ncbi:m7GpppN-mRNA hydrolase-like [Anneissia japonica]|uniref:m7GpppN-mRNA hydrolase-like n=1 Tax=Anneissia japonica TaxID=1529436 RepID=UPI00142571E4|nr:m7GpppN-mRNA hydrolase-like [Anneissia japonica]
MEAVPDIPEDVLIDLISRFLLNVPSVERNNLIRVCFQVELAHWFYLDFYRPERPSLPGCRIGEFARAIFQSCPYLIDHADRTEEILAEWKQYKMSVPTYGAIIMDKDLQHVLLVQGFWSKSSWGFPKGKVNEEEAPHLCAIREVMEETGFNINELIDEKEYIQLTIHDQVSRLYIITGVPYDTSFQPKTRGEIKEIKWFNLNDLPSHKKDNAPRVNLGLNQNNFFMVMPFIKSLKKYVNKKKSQPKVAETPLDSLLLNAQSKQQVQKMEQQATPVKPLKNGQNEAKQITDKQRQRQQKTFALKNQSEFSQYLKFRDSTDSGINGTPGKKQGLQNLRGSKGKASQQKQYQIFTKDKKAKPDGDSTSKKGLIPIRFYAKAFLNFQINREATMAAYDGVLLQTPGISQ